MERRAFDDDGAALGLDLGDVQSSVRRQFAASLAAAFIIAAIAGLVALRPARLDTAESVPHRLAAVQQPSFVIAHGNRVAALARHEIELP